MSRLPSVALAALLAASRVLPAPAAGPEPPPPQFLLSWGKKGQGKGEFRSPIGIAIDQDDRVYVTEFHNNRVQKFDGEGQVLASFPVAEHPGGIAVDRDGNVYVAPLLLGKVCVYGPDGHFVRAWGKPGSWHSTRRGTCTPPRGPRVACRS
ncbi:MAG: NHL repeat-containing protein [Planctomycetes bacterium]|nr:NHL repeat-containing protein [Planctomycetota bacterium]